MARWMGYLGATLRQVFMRAGRADVSLRDVTIAQRGNRGLWVRMTSRTGSARRILWDFEKVSELKLDTEGDGSNSGARWGETNLRATGVARDGDQIKKTA